MEMSCRHHHHYCYYPLLCEEGLIFIMTMRRITCHLVMMKMMTSSRIKDVDIHLIQIPTQEIPTKCPTLDIQHLSNNNIRSSNSNSSNNDDRNLRCQEMVDRIILDHRNRRMIAILIHHNKINNIRSNNNNNSNNNGNHNHNTPTRHKINNIHSSDHLHHHCQVRGMMKKRIIPTLLQVHIPIMFTLPVNNEAWKDVPQIMEPWPRRWGCHRLEWVMGIVPVIRQPQQQRRGEGGWI
mmetsp:Transcript_8259/g.14927  ORF Transcript_8259/g.14927 Transcript_8259/m.14927 type:complete len:237 (-) Transcript_8259:1469-2179(-)